MTIHRTRSATRRGHPHALPIALGALLALPGCVRGYQEWVLSRGDTGPSDGRIDFSAGDGASEATVGEASVDAVSLDARGSPSPPLAVVPAGTFVMGSPVGEPCREPWSSTEPEHAVELSRDLLMHATEVTQTQFAARMSYTPQRSHECPNCPVTSVSWHEAAAYCNAESTIGGLDPCYVCSSDGPDVRCAPAGSPYECAGYRLPTEAEWERAYRAGTTTSLYIGDIEACDRDLLVGDIGWYRSNSGDRLHPVGQKIPNAWGLFDLAGNTWEWCHDWHQSGLPTSSATDPAGPETGTHRVTRGGGYSDDAGMLRAAMRDSERPDDRLPYVGFRCVRSVP